MMPESLRFFGGSSSLAMNKRTPMATMSSAIGTIVFAMLNSTHNSKIVNDLERSSPALRDPRFSYILQSKMINRDKLQEPSSKSQEASSKSQAPRTKFQEPSSKNQVPRAKLQEPSSKLQRLEPYS